MRKPTHGDLARGLVLFHHAARGISILEYFRGSSGALCLVRLLALVGLWNFEFLDTSVGMLYCELAWGFMLREDLADAINEVVQRLVVGAHQTILAPIVVKLIARARPYSGFG